MKTWIPILINPAENYLLQLICGISTDKQKVLFIGGIHFNIINYKKVMKKQSNNSFEKMSKIQLENLTTTMNETLDTNFSQPGKKLFTTADMWLIQRQVKSCTQKRHSIL
jgi:hypothetical protein